VTRFDQFALRAGAAIRQARREGRCGYIGQAPQQTGRPLARNLKGRTLFARGFVAGLVRIARYALRPAPARDAKIVPAQTIKPGYNLL